MNAVNLMSGSCTQRALKLKTQPFKNNLHAQLV